MKGGRFSCAVAAAALAFSCSASAAIITSSLGNTSPGFADGAVPDLITQIIPAQSGQPAPFDGGLGSDVFENASGTWTHSYGALGDPIVSAMLRIGLVDHDSAASGDQVALFTVDGVDLTAALNALLNGSGGGNGEYNVYSVDLGSLAGSLADGSESVVLTLQGAGLGQCFDFLCPDPNNPTVEETGSNGAHYIFAALRIETRDTQGVPEPGTLGLLGLGLGVLALRRRRKH